MLLWFIFIFGQIGSSPFTKGHSHSHGPYSYVYVWYSYSFYFPVISKLIYSKTYIFLVFTFTLVFIANLCMVSCMLQYARPEGLLRLDKRRSYEEAILLNQKHSQKLVHLNKLLHGKVWFSKCKSNNCEREVSIFKSDLSSHKCI